MILILISLFKIPITSQGTDKVLETEIGQPIGDWEKIDTIYNKTSLLGEKTADTTMIFSSNNINTSQEQFGELLNKLSQENVMYYCDNNATSCSGEFDTTFAGSFGDHKVTIS